MSARAFDVKSRPLYPSLNDVITIEIHGATQGATLHWGVNEENDLWAPPQKAYRPAGTTATRDGLAVDTPISKPDSNGVSSVVLGPFNRADQVVHTLHMAVHWDKDWDTDAGRNYNVEISFDTGDQAPRVELLSPRNDEVIVDNPLVQLQAERADRVEMWLDDRTVATVTETPLELKIPFKQLSFGRHQLTARAVLSVGQPAFAWTATNYVRPALDNLVIYEFHLDDLVPGGGFTGVIARLDYIKDLGFNALGPMPWTEFAHGQSWGYNPAFHFAPETAYGTPDELKQLIDAAHQRGLAVIMDAVFNHMDRGSALYQLYGRDYLGSPYFREFKGENWGFPDIEQTSRATKRYFEDAITYWLKEYRVDGIRYDATRFVEWQGYNDWGGSWFAYVGRQVDRDSFMIAEHMPSDPEFINATEMDTTWHDYFRWGIRGMIEEARLDRGELARILDPRQAGFTNHVQRIAYTESHDEERVMRELRNKGFTPEEAFRRAELALALTLTAPGPAMVYAGQEIGENTPKTVGPNPIRWDRTEGWRNQRTRELRESTRSLVHLRTTHPALRGGAVQVWPEGLPDGVAVYARTANDDAVLVAANFGRESRRFKVVPPRGGGWTDVLRGKRVEPGNDGQLSLSLKPGEAVVLLSTASK